MIAGRGEVMKNLLWIKSTSLAEDRRPMHPELGGHTGHASLEGFAVTSLWVFGAHAKARRVHIFTLIHMDAAFRSLNNMAW